jgi:hypothetical protein
MALAARETKRFDALSEAAAEHKDQIKEQINSQSITQKTICLVKLLEPEKGGFFKSDSLFSAGKVLSVDAEKGELTLDVKGKPKTLRFDQISQVYSLGEEKGKEKLRVNITVEDDHVTGTFAGISKNGKALVVKTRDGDDNVGLEEIVDIDIKKNKAK